MRKFLLIVACIFIQTSAIAQSQRLAILPSSLKPAGYGAAEMFSLCIDYFRPTPKSRDNYSYFIDGHGNVPDPKMKLKYEPYSYDKGRFSGTPGNRNELLFCAPELADIKNISAQKVGYIKKRVDQLVAQGKFSGRKLNEFQHEVWAFDILEQLGCIDKALDPIQSFAAGKIKFSENFLGGKIASYQDILDVGYKLHKLDKQNEQPDCHTYAVFKNSRTKEYLVYSKISADPVRGNDQKIIDHLYRNVGNGDFVVLELFAFENILKQEAFLENIQMKLSLMSKDVSIAESYSSVQAKELAYKALTNFDRSNIASSIHDHEVVYEASVSLQDMTYLKETTVQGISNNKSALETFFNYLIAQKEKFVLWKKCRELKSHVMKDLKKGSFLRILLIDEWGKKTLAKVDGNNLEIIYGYVEN